MGHFHRLDPVCRRPRCLVPTEATTVESVAATEVAASESLSALKVVVEPTPTPTSLPSHAGPPPKQPISASSEKAPLTHTESND